MGSNGLSPLGVGQEYSSIPNRPWAWGKERQPQRCWGSHVSLIPLQKVGTEQFAFSKNLVNSCFHFLKQDLASGCMTAVVFSPSKKVMKVGELQRKGYAIGNTPTQLVLRSPDNAEETYLQDVSRLSPPPPWANCLSPYVFYDWVVFSRANVWKPSGPTWTCQSFSLCATFYYTVPYWAQPWCSCPLNRLLGFRWGWSQPLSRSGWWLE